MNNTLMLLRLPLFIQVDRRHNILEIDCGDGSHIKAFRTKTGAYTYATEEDIALFQTVYDEKKADRLLRGTPGSNLFVASHAFSAIVLHSQGEIEKTKHAIRWAWTHAVSGGIVAVTVDKDEIPEVLHYALSGFDLLVGGTLKDNDRGLILSTRTTPNRPTKQQVQTLAEAIEQRRLANGLHYHDRIYQTPLPQTRDQVEPFRSLWRSPEEIQVLLTRSSLISDAVTAVTRGQAALEEVPPLPLKAGHVALQLATGRFNGAVGEGEHRHVVKGRVVRTPIESEEETDEGEIVTTVRQVLSIEVTAVDRTGHVTVLRSDSDEEEEAG